MESEFTDLVCPCTPSCTLSDSCTFPLYVSMSVWSLLGPGWIDRSRKELQRIGVGINAARLGIKKSGASLGWESLCVWTGSIDRRLLGVSRSVVIKVLMTRHPDSPAIELASISRTKAVSAYQEWDLIEW
ncbi:hypothetical protein IW261DRAFT_1420271 [Armillaria novae-zelandiae]|uniref:Uncharacterized protein n=1 Tax=Armillaria novae-zelandiae TaxID=153914 RepID=A0AA39P8P0_9AGAR|nr:hypothetical protein IW261DRAFT_1420271 [Armillaria novae-zelandiae]